MLFLLEPPMHRISICVGGFNVFDKFLPKQFDSSSVTPAKLDVT